MTAAMAITIKVAGTAALQYFFQVMMYPCLAATEIPTTLADAPIGVALPPISVPIESAHANVESCKPSTCDKVLMIGIMVAANGMLSTNALAKAEMASTSTTVIRAWPLLKAAMPSAISFSTPAFSRPPTTY